MSKNVFQPYFVNDIQRWRVGFAGSMSQSAAQAEVNRLNAEIDAANAYKGRWPEQIEAGDTRIDASYHDGEYLSAYEVYGDIAHKLESIGVARYVEGWGYKVQDALVEKLGTSFTLQQAYDLVRPGLIEVERRENEAKDELQAKYTQAAATGKPVLVDRWMEECNDPGEDCSMDNVAKYAMPNGETKIERNHTW